MVPSTPEVGPTGDRTNVRQLPGANVGVLWPMIRCNRDSSARGAAMYSRPKVWRKVWGCA
jgi:hypothetical protein